MYLCQRSSVLCVSVGWIRTQERTQETYYRVETHQHRWGSRGCCHTLWWGWHTHCGPGTATASWDTGKAVWGSLSHHSCPYGRCKSEKMDCTQSKTILRFSSLFFHYLFLFYFYFSLLKQTKPIYSFLKADHLCSLNVLFFFLIQTCNRYPHRRSNHGTHSFRYHSGRTRGGRCAAGRRGVHQSHPHSPGARHTPRWRAHSCHLTGTGTQSRGGTSPGVWWLGHKRKVLYLFYFHTWPDYD